MLAKPEYFSPPDEVCCWPRRRAEMLRPGQRSGDVAGRGAVAENYRESAAGQGAAAELHREANKRTQKEKGPEETLISLPSHFYLLPCERATRHATRPNRRSPLACSAGMHCRRSCRRHSPLAFAADMQCRRSCRRHSVLAQLPLQLCRDCKEGCSKCKNCVELWEYGKDKGVTEYILSV